MNAVVDFHKIWKITRMGNLCVWEINRYYKSNLKYAV